jgi:hypothetical protein
MKYYILTLSLFRTILLTKRDYYHSVLPPLPKKKFWNTILAYVLLRKNLWNGVPVRSITKIPVLPHLSNTILIQNDCDTMENVIHCIVICMFSAFHKGTLNYNKKAGYIAKKSKYSKTWSLRNSRDKKSFLES